MAVSLLYFIREFVEKCQIIKSVEQQKLITWFDLNPSPPKQQAGALSSELLIRDLCQAKSFIRLMSDTRLVFC